MHVDHPRGVSPGHERGVALMALGTVTFDRLPLANGYISGEFKAVYDLGNGKYEHGGADLSVQTGPTLGAHVVNPDAYPERAKVYAINPDNGGDYGNHVILDHQGTEEWSMYAHLDRIDVKPGDLVARGSRIGTVGTANGYYPAHLHFEMRESHGVDIGGGYSLYPLNRLDPEKTIASLRVVAAEKLTPSPLGVMEAKR